MDYLDLVPIEKSKIEGIAFDASTPERTAAQYQQILLSAQKTMKEYRLPEYRIVFLQDAAGSVKIWID